MRRFPPPWTIEALDGGFKVMDSNGQLSLTSTAMPIRAMLKLPLILDEARRIASNIAKLLSWG